MEKNLLPEVIDSSVIRELEIVAAKMRLHIIDSTHSARSGHPGGSLSIAELVAYLYFYRMNVDASNPQMPDRDRFVLSKGHCAPALYSALAMKGFFSEEELPYLRKIGHMLQGHPDKKGTPGVDMSTGSLSQGISTSCGMAIAAKRKGEGYKVYAIAGDGEIQEGQAWEAAMFAAHYGLDNLCWFIDYNNLQITGRTTEVMNLGSIEEKFKAFGWNTVVIDAHDYNQIDAAWRSFVACEGKPTAVICNSIKGKGVSFMEDVCYWHGNPPNDEQHALAHEELVKKLNELIGE